MTGELSRRRSARAAGAALATRRWAGFAGAALALGASWLLTVATRAPATRAAARMTRTVSVDDTGHLHLLNASGAVLVEEGPVSGTLPGEAKVRMVVGATVVASFTIKPRGGGSISGHGRAALHSSSRYASFGGSLSVSRGTGRYAHARGSGGLYGVIDRHTDALTVQAIGRLHY
jgi:hypothetical protein